MNYIAAPAAAADDDNVFYDSGRVGRKIAHYSTFRIHRFSYATLQRPQLRQVEKILFFSSFLCKNFSVVDETTCQRGKNEMKRECVSSFCVCSLFCSTKPFV